MLQEQVTYYPSKDFPALAETSGNSPSDGVRLGVLTDLEKRIKLRITDEEEERACKWLGTEHLRAVGPHTLSPMEELEKLLEIANNKIAEVHALMPRQGDALSLTVEQTDELRRRLGI